MDLGRIIFYCFLEFPENMELSESLKLGRNEKSLSINVTVVLKHLEGKFLNVILEM